MLAVEKWLVSPGMVSENEGGHWCVGVSCLFDYNRV